MHRAARLAQELQLSAGSKKLSAFIAQMEDEAGKGYAGVRELKADVEAFARGFYYPGGADKPGVGTSGAKKQ